MEELEQIGNLSWSDDREVVEKKFQGAYAIRRKPSCYVIPRILGVGDNVSITAEVDFNEDDSVREITLRPHLESRTTTWTDQKARAIQHVLGELRALETARELEVAFREEWDDFEFRIRRRHP